MRALIGLIAVGVLFAGAAGAQAAGPEWTDDLAKMKIPDAKASGKINGTDFSHDKATFTPNVKVLELRQGKDFFPDLSIKVFVFIKDGETIEEKKFEVSTKGGNDIPHVHLAWKVEGEKQPKLSSYGDKYAMKLEFGKKKDGKIPGKIYVCLPDEKKTVVAGTFEVEMK